MSQLAIVLLAFVAVAQAQYGGYPGRGFYGDPYGEFPKPYSFGYSTDDGEGSTSRQEVADGSGRVVGSYSMGIVDGRQRIVDYEADEFGYRANVRTNEPGTDNQNPAAVNVESAAPSPFHPHGGHGGYGGYGGYY